MSLGYLIDCAVRQLPRDYIPIMKAWETEGIQSMILGALANKNVWSRSNTVESGVSDELVAEFAKLNDVHVQLGTKVECLRLVASRNDTYMEATCPAGNLRFVFSHIVADVFSLRLYSGVLNAGDGAVDVLFSEEQAKFAFSSEGMLLGGI